MGSLAKKGEEHVPCTAPGAENTQLVHVAGSRWQAQGELHLQAPKRAPGTGAKNQQPAKAGRVRCGDSREEVGGITGLRQTLPPVDHKPGQGLQ